eukprot:COSAG01_NODE_51996_length_350_cov_0.621514_1_plen_57_part_01
MRRDRARRLPYTAVWWGGILSRSIGIYCATSSTAYDLYMDKSLLLVLPNGEPLHGMQ